MLCIPNAADVQEACWNLATSGKLLTLTTCKAIFEAADSAAAGDTSCTTAAITKSDVTADVEALYNLLGQLGYTVTNGSTTFTVSFGLKG
jgi:hypothetical protein